LIISKEVFKFQDFRYS